MKALLICPAEREGVAALTEFVPLSNLPILGKSLIEYWLEHLTTLGAKEVWVLASDRPEQVRALVGHGARWGLRVTVHPETRELTPAEARTKYRAADDARWLDAPADATLMESLPGLSEFPLFGSYSDWATALEAWLPHAATSGRIGVHEIQPGVWAGLNTHVSPSAKLQAPCWLGNHAYVAPGAVVGPRAILEDRAFVESGAEVSHSVIGPETFVGKLTEVRHSIAWGSTLVSWKLGSCIKVPDAFLLCPLARRRSSFRPASALGRLAAALALLLTLPVAVLVALKSKLRGQPVFHSQIAVRPRAKGNVDMPGDTLIYFELAGALGRLRRWPQLWGILRGDFAWIGNRPLSPYEARRLSNDFERFWLAAPLGVISLADVEGCGDSLGDEACGHASYYAARANWRLDGSIFARALFLFAFGLPFSRARDHLVQLLRQSQAEHREAH
jgi:acetyltransferase-like isoleucine patch superfamily enzyme